MTMPTIADVIGEGVHALNDPPDTGWHLVPNTLAVSSGLYEYKGNFYLYWIEDDGEFDGGRLTWAEVAILKQGDLMASRNYKHHGRLILHQRKRERKQAEAAALRLRLSEIEAWLLDNP